MNLKLSKISNTKVDKILTNYQLSILDHNLMNANGSGVGQISIEKKQEQYLDSLLSVSIDVKIDKEKSVLMFEDVGIHDDTRFQDEESKLYFLLFILEGNGIFTIYNSENSKIKSINVDKGDLFIFDMCINHSYKSISKTIAYTKTVGKIKFKY